MTGLGWRIDHIVGYFAFTLLFCLAWPRPLVVGGILMATAMLLEALQTLTPDRCCDFEAALYRASGALIAAVVGALFIRLNGSARILRRSSLLAGGIVESGL
jgi:hypothetical protein